MYMYVCMYVSVTVRNVTLRNVATGGITLECRSVTRLQNVTRVRRRQLIGAGGWCCGALWRLSHVYAVDRWSKGTAHRLTRQRPKQESCLTNS